MKLKAIIVDDENHNIVFLQKILTEYSSDVLDLVGTANTAAKAVSLINKEQPHLLFLDIKLDIGTSFDVLEQVIDYNYYVIFTTAYQDFALKSFEFNTINYIVKPLAIKDIINSVNKAVKQYQLENYTSPSQVQSMIDMLQNSKSETEYLEVMAIPGVASTLFVRYDKIIYCKSDGRYTEIYLKDEKTKVSAKNIGKYEEILPSKLFLRIHKSYLVNVNHISQILKSDGNYCLMTNGDKLPISKRKYQNLTKLMKLSN